MPLNKMGTFSFKHIDQQDDLYKTKNSSEMKIAFDSQANELKVVLNNLIDALKSQVANDSGAENIGIQPITGVTAANIQEALEDLRLQINAAVAGTIPNGSIGPEKLSFTVAADDTTIDVTDANNHFTAIKLNGVLDELFTSANSVKTNVSGAIGSPSTVNDTGSQLAGYITTEKGRIATNVGDGSSADTLKYLVDRLNVRLDELATNVNTKGVPSTSADTLAQLVTKVGQIPTGVRHASGTVTSGSVLESFQYAATITVVGCYSVTVTDLPFKPDFIIIRGASGVNRYLIEYSENTDTHYPKTVKLSIYDGDGFSGNQQNFKGDFAPASLTETSFKLPILNSGIPCTWDIFKLL